MTKLTPKKTIEIKDLSKDFLMEEEAPEEDNITDKESKEKEAIEKEVDI